MKKTKSGRRQFLAAGAGASLAGMAKGSLAGQDDAVTPGASEKQDRQRDMEGFVPNPAIEQARLVALEILKPSQKEIQQGLAIHRESLVFDT